MRSYPTGSTGRCAIVDAYPTRMHRSIKRLLAIPVTLDRNAIFLSFTTIAKVMGRVYFPVLGRLQGRVFHRLTLPNSEILSRPSIRTLEWLTTFIFTLSVCSGPVFRSLQRHVSHLIFQA